MGKSNESHVAQGLNLVRRAHAAVSTLDQAFEFKTAAEVHELAIVRSGAARVSLMAARDQLAQAAECLRDAQPSMRLNLGVYEVCDLITVTMHLLDLKRPLSGAPLTDCPVRSVVKIAAESLDNLIIGRLLEHGKSAKKRAA